MQHTGLGQLSKTILTITGLMLLIIFGTRAASQASSVAAVGGQTKKSVGLTGTHAYIGQFALLSSTGTTKVPYGTSLQEPVVDPEAHTVSKSFGQEDISESIKGRAKSSVENTITVSKAQYEKVQKSSLGS